MANKAKKELLKELEALANTAGVKVRYEKTDARGGMCQFKGKQLIIINKQSSDDYKINVILDNLKKLDLKDIYIAPNLREMIENSI